MEKISVLIEYVSPGGLAAGMAMALDEIGGVQIDTSFSPVAMRPRGPAAAMGNIFPNNVEDANEPTVVVRADIALDQVAAIRERRGVVALWSDPRIEPIGRIDCDPNSAKGTSSDIARALGADRIWQEGRTQGDGVIIGIVDGGVDGQRFRVAGGWSPDPASPPGDADVAWGGHGNMCAHDSLIACPAGTIFDYSIGKTVGDVPALLSSVLQAFTHAQASAGAPGGGPSVMSNSWGLYQQLWDPFPPGHPMNYTHNVNHVVTRKIMEVLDDGMLVTFAAGNCGQVCPSAKCGHDVGPGKSIRGANGHERVICVGAVNALDDWIGYSSQGPSTLSQQKPDVCGFSHFQGFFPVDTGTSAACPVVAGVLGLMRAACRPFDQDRAREALKKSARMHTAGVWSNDFGFGIVDAYAAYQLLK